MNAKQVKYYEIVSGFFASDIFNAAVVNKYFGDLLKLDYSLAEDLWEFMLIRNDSDLKNPAVTSLYIDKLYNMFVAANAAKAAKTIVDRPVILRAIFRFSAAAAKGDLFMLPVNLLASNKVDVADAILKQVMQNEAMKPSFGQYMIDFLDRLFIEITKKDAQRRVKLNTKQSQLLLSTVQKVKGDERAMLVQRVKEVL